jgi:hypothetical protein
VSSVFASRLRRRFFHHRWLGPALGEWDRWRLRRALARRGLRHRRVLGPPDLAGALTALVPYPRTFELGAAVQIDAAVLRTDSLQSIDARALGAVRERMACTHLAGRYALFEADAPAPATGADVEALLLRLDEIRRGEPAHRPAPPPAHGDAGPVRRAVLVTTYARPAALRRSLPQIVALGAPVLVVDDGSPAPASAANREICAAAGAAYLLLPDNRGLPTAINVGLSMLMAEPAVRWISYFQDDVDVSPDTLTRLAPLEDAAQRPLLTGQDAGEHPVVDRVEIAGIAAARKRSTRGSHLHAHVDYWAGVMPIPSPYLGAPKPGAGSSMEDWWIVNHAPGSVERRGLLVVCVPGLVRTFLWHRDDSTWDNPSAPDPQLR